METTYQTGMDQNVIQLTLTVSTPALAQSVAYTGAMGAAPVKVAESNLLNGNIASNIGTGSTLKNKFLVITSTIDCNIFPAEQWPDLARTLAVEYVLSGGLSGPLHTSPSEDEITVTQNGRLITVTKAFNLV